MNMQKGTQLVIAGLLLILILIPLKVSADKAEPSAPPFSGSLIVQTKGNPVGFAIPGTSGFSQSADLSVVVTTGRGAPVSDLGPPFIGDGSSVISLPPEWIFDGNFTRPNGACALLPTQFFNGGDGKYIIRVISAPEDCPWVGGDYHYVVQISGSGKHSQLQGSALGVLPIRSSF
jgi:hypothetical protein